MEKLQLQLRPVEAVGIDCRDCGQHISVMGTEDDYFECPYCTSDDVDVCTNNEDEICSRCKQPIGATDIWADAYIEHNTPENIYCVDCAKELQAYGFAVLDF